VAACLSGLPACGTAPAPAPRQAQASEPRWQDVFDRIPELFVVVRPRGLRQDPVYGPLLRRALEAVREKSRVVAATRALEAIDDADEVLAGVRAEAPDRPGGTEGMDGAELVLVARGVRADLDPGKLVDADGRSLWQPGPSGRVRELVREPDARGARGADVAASLFELPGRTWVIASGEARVRAREVFEHPVDRPMLDLDRDALAVVRLDGPSLVQRVRSLHGTGELAAVGRRLQSVTLALPPGSDRSIRATLSYADEDAAAFAEVALRECFRALGRASGEKAGALSWLGGAAVDRPQARAGREIVVSAPLPPRLIDALLQAGGAATSR
jgi:hypothetical protein